MPHIRIWKFRPPADREPEFARAYGARGVWSSLFAEAEGYLGTTLLRPAQPGACWLTIDRWERPGHFAAFQRDFDERYRALDLELEGIAGDEEFVGAFEED